MIVRLAVLVAVLCMASVSFAAKTYQVTGPILEVTDKTIVVEKDKEKWELDRDAAAKVTGGELKVGEKVTIHYTMTVKSIEVKGEKAAKEAKPEAAAKEAKAAPAKEAKEAKAEKKK